MVTSLVSSIDEAEKHGLLEGTREEVIAQVFEPWRNKKMRAYLQKKYPLLNVSDLDVQIAGGLKMICEEKKCKTSKVAT